MLTKNLLDNYRVMGFKTMNTTTIRKGREAQYAIKISFLNIEQQDVSYTRKGKIQMYSLNVTFFLGGYYDEKIVKSRCMFLSHPIIFSIR